MMNLVVGATGLLGSEICRQLAEQGKPVRALVRKTSGPNKIENLKKSGAQLAYGDLKDKSSLDTACQGVTAVISTASSTFSRQEGDSIQTVDLEGQIHLIDAAQAAGVQQFILISFVKDPAFPFPLSEAKSKVENHLKNSGMTYTILEANFFMEVWLSDALGFDAVHATARIYGEGQPKISWISYLDVAKFAVAVLDNPHAQNTVIQVGGPEALSPLEVVKIFEETDKKPFTVEHIPVEALQAQKENAPDPLQESFAALMLGYAYGNPMDMRQTLQTYPVQMMTVRDYAKNVLASS